MTCRSLSFKRLWQLHFTKVMERQHPGTMCEIRDQQWYIMALEGQKLSPMAFFRLDYGVM